jgi:hypothetical protein
MFHVSQGAAACYPPTHIRTDANIPDCGYDSRTLKIAPKNAMYDIFLSYSSQDRDRLVTLVEVFRQQGWTVFWDHQSVPVGKTYAQYIEDGLRDSTCVVVVWSENSIKSEWVREEANKAKKRGVMLPVRLDHNVPPFGFSEYQAADFSQWQGDTTSPAFQSLAAAVRGHVDAARAQAERQTKQDQLAQQQAQLTRLQTELQQQQQVLQRSETQLAEQRELLELRSQAAQQKERDRQTEFVRQTADLEKQRDELARQTRQSTANDLAPTLAAAERHAADLSAQLQTAREQARFAEQQAAESAQRLTDEIAANQSAQAQLVQQLADAQAQQEKLSAQIKALDDKQQELLRQAASDKQELIRQQTELKQQQQRVEQAKQAERTAQEKQQTAEQARQIADKNRQTAEDKLRTAEKNQQAEQARLNQQLAEQQHELTTLRTRPPVEVEKVVEKIVEKVVVKEVRSPKDKFIGIVIGGVLVAAAWGVMGNHSEPAVVATIPVTPAANAPTVNTTAPVSEVQKTPEPTTVDAPTAASAEQTRLQEMQRMKIALRQGGGQTAADALEKLQPLDAEAELILGAYYYKLQQFQTACPRLKAAADAGNAKAKTLYRKSEKCRKTP